MYIPVVISYAWLGGADIADSAFLLPSASSVLSKEGDVVLRDDCVGCDGMF